MDKFHLPTIETEVLKYWEDQDIFRRLLARPARKGNYVFFEGPPTANGKPGLHHVLARSFKDVVLRFWTMRGYNIDRKAGWDTHGLPVELETEKQLGFTRKQDIEDYGIAKFNAKCKESVWKYLDLWRQLTRRAAFWVDLDDAYVTYKNEYIESLWWILKKFEEKGLLYKGHRVTPHCPRCVTSLSSHELAQGYKEVDDESVYVKFPVDEASKRYFLVWTTTPWTLAGNTALAVGADLGYSEIKLKKTGETLILATGRLGVISEEYEVLGEKTGRELVGTAYKPLYSVLAAGDANAGRGHKVCAADFVSIGDGTGIVHIAPAFGEDDAKLGEAEKLPVLFTVDPTGMVTSDTPGKGKFIKKADTEVKADLAARGLLYRSETIRHAYPFCWRCGTPILYFAKSSWYIRMSSLRERLQKNNARINWVPEHIREGRFGEWLREVKDWAISRERYWGTPLPVWFCEKCPKREVVGSLDDLRRMSSPRNRYLLMRHGESENNVAGVVSSWPEKKPWPLTAHGREQAAAAVRKLKTEKVTHIFASDIARTRETAEIVAKGLGLEVSFDERLREVGLGERNGIVHGDYVGDYQSTLERFDVSVRGSEPLRSVRRRMVDFIKDMERRFSGETILIVTHGDPLWMVETGFAGLDDATAAGMSYNGNGECRELKIENLPYDDEGHVDLHRPFIDDVRLSCPACGGTMRRVPEVIDCWFDSGSMPFAQWHYPFENADRIDSGRNFPAAFISEAIDQTRGWFYTLLAVSTALGYDVPPYKNCICLGHILDAKGQKMSKSKGNVVDPWAMFDKYGADAVRYHFFTVNPPGEPKSFDEKALDEVTKKVFLILWNVLTFWKTYAADGKAPAKLAKAPKNMLDRWVLAELGELTEKMTAEMGVYDVVGSCRRLGDFVNCLSTWYLRRSRDRFKSEDAAEKVAAVAILGHVLLVLSKLMAPFTPLLAEALYKEVGGPGDSVHLDEWPEPVDTDKKRLEIMGRMNHVRKMASLGLEKRAQAGIPVRQVLAKAIVSTVKGQGFKDWQKEILADELNVERVEHEEVQNQEPDWSQFNIVLDTELTPELKRKGAAREMVRHVNNLRKEAGLTVGDRIKLYWESGDAFWREVFAEHGPQIGSAVLADAVSAGRIGTEIGKEIETDAGKVWVGIVRV